MASTHIVESTPETVRSGYLDPAAKPLAVIQPGDTVRYPNIWTHWGNEARFGWNSFPLGVGALPHDFAEPYVHYFTFAASLDDALVACLREVIYWLPAAAGLTGPEAYALASMAVSFRVTQYANQTGSAYTSTRPRRCTRLSPRPSSLTTSAPGSRPGLQPGGSARGGVDPRDDAVGVLAEPAQPLGGQVVDDQLPNVRHVSGRRRLHLAPAAGSRIALVKRPSAGSASRRT